MAKALVGDTRRSWDGDVLHISFVFTAILIKPCLALRELSIIWSYAFESSVLLPLVHTTPNLIFRRLLLLSPSLGNMERDCYIVAEARSQEFALHITPSAASVRVHAP